MNISRSLHSNLVLFKSKKPTSQDNYIIDFTFQSGSIQISYKTDYSFTRLPLHSNLVLFKFGYKIICVFFFATLHSNLVLFKSLSSSRLDNTILSFTFQSGSIQISSFKAPYLLLSIFTFQSGSIQIPHMDITGKSPTVLYIPIWFYSNEDKFLNASISLKTLHSNLVLFKCRYAKGIYAAAELYIPIWFYSNSLYSISST